MRTIVEHISDQIANTCAKHDISSIFITGGGAYNDFLIDRIREKCSVEIIIPNASLIEFKEAIIFGLLGALYLDGRPNTLSSVTGATHDVIGGVLHLP
jgi:anhydro-N-acetylmuramic acid kinase